MHHSVTSTKAIPAATCLLILIVAAHAQGATNWPQFRGAESRGIGEGVALATEWSATENVEWKTDIPGRAWSSPIVWGNRVFLTTAVSEGEMEAVKKGLYFGGERPKPDVVYHWKVYALDIDTGDVVWEREVHAGKPSGSIHIKNSFASETPSTDGERVYAYFGNIGLFCLDFDGNLLWEKRVDFRLTANGWGPAASPTLHGDRLYVVNDNNERSYLMALDKVTGKEIWKVERDEGSNWSTPFVWENGQRTEIVTTGSGKVRSYDLDGKLLWTLEGMSSLTIATPYEFAGLLFITSGYVGDKSRPIYCIAPGADGDISLGDGESKNRWIRWSLPQAAPYNPSTIMYEGRLYVLYDRGQLACFGYRSGEEIFARQRIPDGRGFTASPWANDGKIFCLNEDGVTFVFEAGEEFNLLGTNRLAEDDMGMATPAISDDRLLIRTSKRIYCIREKV